jgi:catechol 2,3-dioxygenase-like lactoylglutathione lyase family enzyme
VFEPKAVFSGFSVDDIEKAKEFYTKTLGLTLKNGEMGLTFSLPGGGELFIYTKPDHTPANYTALNFVVDDIDAAVDELTKRGVAFEHYDNMPMQQDEKGIARGLAANMGPDIAWFKDPAGNVLAVLHGDWSK